MIENILKNFPKQNSTYPTGTQVSIYPVNGGVKICSGEIVRYDDEEPYLTILKSYDGKYILGNECKWSI